MHKHTAKRTALLQEGFRSVLYADSEKLVKTATVMSRDFDYWRSLLRNACFVNMTSEDTQFLLHSEDLDTVGAQLFMAGTPKNMLSHVPLGVIELRDQPIERLTYRGKLERKNRIASLLVLAGYNEAENFNSLAELSENLKTRAEYAVNPPTADEPAEEVDIEAAEVAEVADEQVDSHFSNLEALMTSHHHDEDELIDEGETTSEEDAEEASMEPAEPSEEAQTKEPLTEEPQAFTEPQEGSQHMVTTVPDVTDPVVLKELRDKVAKELVEDRRNVQVAALHSLNPFKRRAKKQAIQPEKSSTARKITVVQEFSTPGALPFDVIIETNVLNDDEDTPILVDEWTSIENLFSTDSTKV